MEEWETAELKFRMSWRVLLVRELPGVAHGVQGIDFGGVRCSRLGLLPSRNEQPVAMETTYIGLPECQ